MSWHDFNDRMRRAVGLPNRDDDRTRGRRDYDHKAPRFAWLVVAMLSIALLFNIVNFNVDDNQGNQIAYDSALSDFKFRASQRNACHKSGNVLREDIRNEFADLKLTLIEVFREVRNTIPPQAESYRILDDAIRGLYGRIKTLPQRFPNAACNELYPAIARPDPGDYGL